MLLEKYLRKLAKTAINFYAPETSKMSAKFSPAPASMWLAAIHSHKKTKKNMTIQINRDAVLYVLSQPPQPDSSAPTAYQCHYHAPHLQPYDDEAEIVVNPGKEEAVIRLVPVSAHNASVPRPQSKPDVREAPIEAPRRVQFADELVTDVWTRPRTPPGDLRALFYSYEETQR